ncbi:hypothetical protein IE53DRAFT_383813 [Violaceomyces palustris]|uniref:Uncharacterized protein n=1 Tax=Violaceomyces palustris TaxID=1673888 RepID=A0ACD0P6G3_9BASI|nr:hypothetical protein IE53DRAFT_383813 [Violaceomyces palustris]
MISVDWSGSRPNIRTASRRSSAGEEDLDQSEDKIPSGTSSPSPSGTGSGSTSPLLSLPGNTRPSRYRGLSWTSTSSMSLPRVITEKARSAPIPMRRRLILKCLIFFMAASSFILLSGTLRRGRGWAANKTEALRSISKLLPGGHWSTAKIEGASYGSSWPIEGYSAKLPSLVPRIKSYDGLLETRGEVLDTFISQGRVALGSVVDLSEHSKIDGLWFYVNGSDPRHALARQFYVNRPDNFFISPETSLPDGVGTWDGPVTNEEEEGIEFGDEPEGEDPEASGSEKKESDVKGQQPGFAKRKGSPKLEKRASFNKQMQNTNNRFRDNGELKYSLRSARQYFGNSLGTQHLVTTDFWQNGFPDPSSTDGSELSGSDSYQKVYSEWKNGKVSEELPGETMESDVLSVEGGLKRNGQLPQWLNTSSPNVAVGDDAGKPGKVLFRVHHDWNMARPLTPIPGMSKEETERRSLQWKLATLPTFNSMSAEAVLGLDVPGLSEFFFYSNDDMFFQRRMSAADFFTPIYGPVLRMNPQYMIAPEEHPETRLGEGPSLFWSNFLVSKRFGTKKRAWFQHFQKTYSRPHLLESRTMWPEEFDDAAAHRFRGGGVQANSHFLTYHFMIERHREALLWSFFVLRLDSAGSGRYSDSDVQRARKEMGSTSENGDIVKVPMPKRVTLDHIDETLEITHLNRPKSTTYLFSSMDGSASARMPADEPDMPWSDFSKREDRVACKLDIGSCWPAGERDAATVFKRFSFERPECGDCLITHLVGQSGKQGLNAFLPPKNSEFPLSRSAGRVAKNKAAKASLETTPHLPLGKDFKEVDFSLASVAKTTGWDQGSAGSRRQFAVRMIQRYNYIIGQSSAFYWSLKTPTNTKEGLQGLRVLKDERRGPSMICLNDDLEKGAKGRKQVHKYLNEWFEESFPQPLPFEKAQPKHGPLNRS